MAIILKPLKNFDIIFCDVLTKLDAFVITITASEYPSFVRSFTFGFNLHKNTVK